MEERMDLLVGKAKAKATMCRVVAAVVLVAIAITSLVVLSPKYSSADAYSHEIEQLDKRKWTASAMSVAAVTASAVITSIPDDVGTPIANELAEISKGLGLVTGAIILEKYAMTVLGYALFGAVLPFTLIVFAACLLLPFAPDLKRTGCLGLGRVLLATVIIWYSIPLGVRVSDMIYSTYEESMNKAIEQANYAEQISRENSQQEEGSGEGEKKEFTLSIEGVMGVIGDAATGVANAVGDAVETVTDTVTVAVEWAKVVLTGLTEGFAVMLVITIVIPILVPAAMIWAVKLLFQPSGPIMPALPALPPASLIPMPSDGVKKDTNELTEV